MEIQAMLIKLELRAKYLRKETQIPSWDVQNEKLARRAEGWLTMTAAPVYISSGLLAIDGLFQKLFI